MVKRKRKKIARVLVVYKLRMYTLLATIVVAVVAGLATFVIGKQLGMMGKFAIPGRPTITPTTAPAPTMTPNLPLMANSDWQRCAKPKYHISFDYPPTAKVVLENHNTTQEVFSVYDVMSGMSVVVSDSPDIPFNRPPANADVTEWVLHNKDYEMSGYKVGASRTIAGIKALHLFFTGDKNKTPRDTYYVIKDSRLYVISFAVGDHYDKAARDRFLDSVEISSLGNT